MLKHVGRTLERSVYPRTKYHFNSCSLSNNEIGIPMKINLKWRGIKTFLNKI